MTGQELISTDASGSALASWTPLVVLLVVYVLIVVALLVRGRGGFFERIPNALQRLTGIPGWACAAIGTSMFGLLVAGQGFYSDVAWHIALGRDDELFTAPHTSIVAGLGLIFAAAGFGIFFATVERVPTRLRIGGLRVPLSMVPLAALGGAALTGFPLDEIWHRAYGVDVTMWSPTHMIMILGAAFSGMASWLILADAGVSPTDSRWARGVHVAAAWLLLMALVSPQGEFSFGVPQFQQIFHPILVTLAGATALVAIRLVHGRGWALGIVAGSTVLSLLPLFGDDGPVATREGGLYLVSALIVEVVAVVLGTDRRLRFAVWSGAGVATIGLAAEWVWNQRAYQPWTSNLLPDAIWLCLVVGIGGAVIGAAFATTIRRERVGGHIPGRLVAGAGMAVLLALALPMPRSTGAVTATIHVDPSGPDLADVEVTLAPAEAADDARWFQTISWQGGGLVIAEMEQVGPGRYRTDRPIPVTGRGKALVRLHRGGQLMAAPVYFPADPEIGAALIAARDRTVAMTGERSFLLRETTGGGGAVATAIYLLFGLIVIAWIAAFTFAARRISDTER